MKPKLATVVSGRFNSISTLAAIAILSSWVSYAWIIAPSMEQLNRARWDESELKAAFENKQRLAAQLDDRRERNNAIPVTVVDMRLAPETNELENIAELAAISDVTVTQTELIDSVKREFAEELTFEIQASGSYSDIVGFIARLAVGTRIFTAENIELRRGDADIRASLLVLTHRYLPADE